MIVARLSRHARRCAPAVFVVAAAIGVAWTCAPAVRAQTRASSSAPASPSSLPVRRVILYKSGVGYFEHLGRVHGSQAVTISFTSGQLDDVLQSLTTLDLDGGRVLGISYNSEAALDRRLGALRLPVGQAATREQFLSALRGARLEVTGVGSPVVGRLLSVERIDRRTDGSTVTAPAVSLVTDAGELRTVALDPGVGVRILESDLTSQVSQYLSLVASARDADVRRLTISTSGTGDRDLFVSYVTEVPVWKSTYRLVLPDGSAPAAAGAPSKPLLQGWAIVDNTGGEDWTNVQLSLVAGAPQSFIQSISRPYYVQRPVVPLPASVLLAPQTHEGALGAAGAGSLAGSVADPSGGALPGVTVRAVRAGAVAGVVVTDASGRYRMPNVAPGSYDVSFALNGFRTTSYSNVAVSGGMESVLNATMDVGSVSSQVQVSAGPPVIDTGRGAGRDPSQVVEMAPGAPLGSAGGLGGGGRGGRGGALGGLPNAGALETAMASQQTASGAELGDLFQYTLKESVTVRQNESALVPVVNGDVTAEKVSLWNPADGTRPMRAVWLTNTTGETLDGGSFSVLEGQAFAGEGLMDPLKAGERRLLSYAVDLGVTVTATGEPVPARVTRVRFDRGMLVQSTEERQRRTYVVRNDDTTARTVVIEHPARAGWTVAGSVQPIESTADWHRFRFPVDPKTTATFVVDEARPGEAQYEIGSITDDRLELLVRGQAIDAATEASLREVLRRKAEVARLDGELAARQREVETIGTDQDRVRENMKSLKGSDAERQLLQRYVKELDDEETRLGALRQEMISLTAARQKAQADLDAYIDGLSTAGRPLAGGPVRKQVVHLGRRDARLASRDDRDYRACLRDEQRRQAGWIGGPNASVISRQDLT